LPERLLIPVRIKTIHIVIVIAAVIVAAGGWVWAFYELPEPEVCDGFEYGYYEGSLYVNEAGKPKGDSNYTATYNATLGISEDGIFKFLGFMYVSGDGDKLTQHPLNVSGFCEEFWSIRFSLEGNAITLEWVPEDLVWDGNYSNHFIASWGPEADPDENRGSILANYFPGLAGFSYVELRLQPK